MKSCHNLLNKSNLITQLLQCSIVLFISICNGQEVKQPPLHAYRIHEPISIDGILDEPAWLQAPTYDHFTQSEPTEWAQPSMKTHVILLYDNQALYVGAWMNDPAPDSLATWLARRDAYTGADQFGIAFDSYHDKRNGYYFKIDVGGTLFDGVLYNDEWSDDTWDGVWEGKTSITKNGWCAELRIPFSQLRFHDGDSLSWGVDCYRYISRLHESDYIVFKPRIQSGYVSRFIELQGLSNLQPPMNVEILPYVESKGEYLQRSSDDPFQKHGTYSTNAGLDLKVGLSSNLTLTGAINPDFGQVEVDPAVVNLSDVESYFQEKRPFFIEGATIFNFGLGGASNNWIFDFPCPEFLYTRRIGRAPHGSIPTSDWSDIPVATQILGAAKLTGKLGDSWNVGTIQALTNREMANIVTSGNHERVEIEPLTYYAVFRAQRDFNDSRQGLGFLATVTERDFSDDRLRAEMNKSSFFAGTDGWIFLDDEKEWVINGWLAMTRVAGTLEDMIALQTNSQHYFQRPDISYLHIDSSRTSMNGLAGRVTLNKQKGNFYINAAFSFVDPFFDNNDIGFTYRADVIGMHAVMGYNWTEPGPVIQRASVYLGNYRGYNFGGYTTSNGIYIAGNVTFSNYIYINYNSGYELPSIAPWQTRGGPMMTQPNEVWKDVSINTNDSKPFYITMYAHDEKAGNRHAWNVGTSLQWKPIPSLALTINPEYYFNHDDAQYDTTINDPAATVTFGKRYVFSDLDQTTISTSFRVNWTFTPQLSLQMYVQPFFSTGNNTNFKELTRPSSRDFYIYGTRGTTITREDNAYTVQPDGIGNPQSFTFDDPNFNLKSLRGNAVLRWEYTPGSVLYFVWTQNRYESDIIGEVQFNQSIYKLWNIAPDNIFMVKFSYWWNR
jgi:hypothetical protein